MGQNKILNASNQPLGVTNFISGQTFATIEGVPLTTSDGTATGPICVRVVLGGAPPPATGGSFETTFINATSGSTIPTDVLGWSITAISGTVTVDGDALPNGSTVRGGGYPGYTLGTAVTYTVAAGVALVTYDSVL